MTYIRTEFSTISDYAGGICNFIVIHWDSDKILMKD